MKVTGMLRVKNEERWIERCLASILPLCDEIIVLDDHSTDATFELCKAMPKTTVYASPFEDLNEARDKNFLLCTITEGMPPLPDWIIAIDGDEVLAEGSVELLRRQMESNNAPCLSLRVRYLWDSENQVRCDGVYGDFHRESVFRPEKGVTFHSNPSGGAHFHCGNVPAPLRMKRAVLSNVELLHFGYLHREDRIRKYHFYNQHDPGNAREDQYKHMVIGDIYPAESRFRHGGPLFLEPLQKAVAA